MTNNNHVSQKISDLLTDRKNQDPESQIAEATRIVSEIETVDTHKAYVLVEERIMRSEKKIRILNLLTRVAAVLFIPLLIASAWLFYHRSTPIAGVQFAMQQITTPPGVRSQVVLPDGSNVWLNAESTIKFKVPFDQTSRDISLSGEAYFEVKKNTDAPFTVQSGKVQVKVLGTKFNCKGFKDEHTIEVVLAEGKVSMNTPGGNKGKEQILNPGERAIFDKGLNETQIITERIDKYIAWHSGKLVFDETPMTEVAVQLGRWYGIEVAIKDPKILKYRITTTFENESLHQVLELLKLSSPINIVYVSAKVDKTNQTQTKAKVILTGKN